MKKIITITVITLLILAAWIGGCSRGGYRQGLKDGAKIERLKKAAFWDSINLAQSQEVISGFEKINANLNGEINALESRLWLLNVGYENRIKSLHTLPKHKIDSLYKVFAKDSIEAVEKFFELQKCAEESVLLHQKINLIESISINDQNIIKELKSFIESDKVSRIELRDQNATLTEKLALTENKLKRRTAQRNITWCGLIVIGVGLIILN